MHLILPNVADCYLKDHFFTDLYFVGVSNKHFLLTFFVYGSDLSIDSKTIFCSIVFVLVMTPTITGKYVTFITGEMLVSSC